MVVEEFSLKINDCIFKCLFLKTLNFAYLVGFSICRYISQYITSGIPLVCFHEHDENGMKCNDAKNDG